MQADAKVCDGYKCDPANDRCRGPTRSFQLALADPYETLTRRFDQERIWIHEAQHFTCVQPEAPDVREQRPLGVLMHLEPAATGILNQNAANILH